MHSSSHSGSARQAPQEPATRLKVISMRDVPSTLSTRPQRPGPTDRFEPSDALIRTYVESDRFHVCVWDALPGSPYDLLEPRPRRFVPHILAALAYLVEFLVKGYLLIFDAATGVIDCVVDGIVKFA